MKYIKLQNSTKRVMVDDEDWPWLVEYKWTFHHGSVSTKFMFRRFACNGIMHRMILNAPKGLEVDHINHNQLDNRKCNLRLATRSQNAANNRPSKTRKKASKFKGVGKYHGGGNRWIVRVGAKYMAFVKGQINAARLYNRLAREKWGDFAYQNPV